MAMQINKTLKKILEWRRGHGTQSYSKFLDWLEEQLPADEYRTDSYGNIWVDRGGHKLFACHTDTVEVNKSSIGPKQLVHKGKGIITAQGNDTLGADDGAGIWLMLNMLKANVEGLYCFFASEEVGCVGSSSWIEDHQERLKDIDIAIEFDRKGTKDIVTDMFVGETASAEFCAELEVALMGDHTSAIGTVTDVANMADVVSECVNLSVGYSKEHTNEETLDLVYLTRLNSTLLKLDWDSLNCYRKEGDFGTDYWSDSYRYRESSYQKYYGYGDDPLFDMVYDDPDLIVQYLKSIGVTVEEIRDSVGG